MEDIEVKPKKKKQSQYLKQTSSLSVSVLFILPAFVLYELGIFLLSPPYQNGVGAIFKILVHTLGARFDTRNLLILNAIIILVLVIVYLRKKKKGGVRSTYYFTMIIEATAYAVVLAMFAFLFANISTIAKRYIDMSLLIPTDTRLYVVLANVIYAFGAGLYEEIFFRLCLMNFLLFLFARRIAKNKVQYKPLFFALLISSILFAAAHGIFDVAQFAWQPMLFRTVSGMFFGIIYILRGLSVAVYMHIMYDLIVFAL